MGAGSEVLDWTTSNLLKESIYCWNDLWYRNKSLIIHLNLDKQFNDEYNMEKLNII